MQLVEYTVSGGIGSITLNRPEKRNALSPELIGDIRAAFVRAERDDQVRIVVLKAAGESFCAGADLEYLQKLQQFTYAENLEDSARLKDLFWQIYTHPKVVIAQVQGHALAGGCGLVTVCDFCFASSDARFGYTEVKIGFVPALVMSFLLRRIGEGRARQLLLTGTLIDAKEAYTIGLINCVCEKKMLAKDVQGFAEAMIRANSSQAMKTTKQLIVQAQSLIPEEALSMAAEANAKARGSTDFRRGIAAFLNKEKMDWSKVKG